MTWNSERMRFDACYDKLLGTVLGSCMGEAAELYDGLNERQDESLGPHVMRYQHRRKCLYQPFCDSTVHMC